MHGQHRYPLHPVSLTNVYQPMQLQSGRGHHIPSNCREELPLKAGLPLLAGHPKQLHGGAQEYIWDQWRGLLIKDRNNRQLLRLLEIRYHIPFPTDPGILEKVIARKRKEFRDSSTKENIDKLNQQLMDVSKIMSENFEMILNRDQNLKKISQLSSDLKYSSSQVRIVNC
jgi:hypothetical protein